MSTARQALAPNGSRARYVSRVSSNTATSPLRSTLPLLTLVVAIVGLAIAGALLAAQMLARPSAGRQPARPGEAVSIPGGLLRVDGVTPESMAPMQMDKFARSGMSMSGMGMDVAPEGYRRFSVAVTLAGEGSAGLRYDPDRFRLGGEGLPETGPLRHQLGDGAVPRGHTISGSLTFQVPEPASGLSLSFPGADRAILLDLAASGASHDHLDNEESGQHDH